MQKNNRKKCKIIDTSIEIIDGDRGKHYPKNNELLPHGFCLFLNTKNLPGSVFDFSSTQFISQEKDSALRKGKLQNNDIVFTTRGTLGHLAWFKDNILYKNVRINSGMVILRNKDNLIDTKFLFLQLASSFVRKQIASLSTGSAQPQLPIKDFLNLEIYLPPIEEQKRIAGVLGAFDDKIELLQKQNTTLENMAKALFKSWFVDFDVVHAKQQGQPKAAVMQQYHLTEELYNLFPSSFEPSALGPIPTGWQVKPLSQIATFLNGLALQKYPANDNINYLPVIKIAELRNGLSTSSDRASCDIPAEYIVYNGDILFSWSGSLMVKIWPGKKGALNQHLFKVASLEYPKWFYYMWIKYHLPFFQEIAADKATTMGHIQRKHLDQALVCIPKNLNIYTRYFASLIDKQILNNKQIQTLTEMRDGLLPRLISGKIRV